MTSNYPKVTIRTPFTSHKKITTRYLARSNKKYIICYLQKGLSTSRKIPIVSSYRNYYIIGNSFYRNRRYILLSGKYDGGIRCILYSYYLYRGLK